MLRVVVQCTCTCTIHVHVNGAKSHKTQYIYKYNTIQHNKPYVLYCTEHK